MNSPSHHHEDHPHVVSRNARYGLILFAVYVVLYGGFIYLSVFQTETLGKPIVAGMNLAVVYGFGLIVAALVLSMVYWVLCSKPVHKDAGEGSDS